MMKHALTISVILAVGGGPGFEAYMHGKLIPGDPDANRLLRQVNSVDSVNDPQAARKLFLAIVRPTPEKSERVHPIVRQVALYKILNATRPSGAGSVFDLPRPNPPHTPPPPPSSGLSDEFTSLSEKWLLDGPPGSMTVSGGFLRLDTVGPGSGWNVTQGYQPVENPQAFTLEVAFGPDIPEGTAAGFSFNVGNGLGSWMRVEIVRSGGVLDLYALSNIGGGTYFRRPAPTELVVRLTRVGELFAVLTRDTSGAWQEVGHWNAPVVLTSLGLYGAARSGSSITAAFDYLREISP